VREVETSEDVTMQAVRRSYPIGGLRKYIVPTSMGVILSYDTKYANET